MADQLWTVARFPNGSWSTGGKPTDPDYAQCEVWQIPATSREAATEKAQARRSRTKRAGAERHPMTPEQTTRFEAWARSQGHSTRKERGRYAEGVVNKMRDAWMQARKGTQ